MSRRHDFDCDPDQEERYAEWMAHVLDLPQDDPSTQRGGRAGIDGNAGHDSAGTEREIPDDRRPGPDYANHQFAVEARARKVSRLLGVLRADKKTATDAEQMTISEWYALAHKAGVNKPSATSRGMIIAAMKRAEEEDHF